MLGRDKRHLEVIRAVEVAAIAHELWLSAADVVATVNLVLVDGHTSHIGAGSANDATQGAADAAAHVENAVVVFDVQLRRYPVLRVEDCHAVRLVPPAEAEVEGITPAVLVEITGEVVERVCNVAVVRAVLVVAANFGVCLLELGGVLSARHALPHNLEEAAHLLGGVAVGNLVQKHGAYNKKKKQQLAAA